MLVPENVFVNKQAYRKPKSLLISLHLVGFLSGFVSFVTFRLSTKPFILKCKKMSQDGREEEDLIDNTK